MNVNNLSINQLLDVLGIQGNELISRNQINVVIERKLEFTQDKNKRTLLARIQKKLNSYLDELDLNTIFRGDDLSLTKNIVNSQNDSFTITNPSMKAQNTFIQTEASGDLNPLKKRTKAHILHINTRLREKNLPDLYNKQLIKSVKNTLPSIKIQQLLNNRININSIIISADGVGSLITLTLDVDLPKNTDVSSLTFILNENINFNNIFKRRQNNFTILNPTLIKRNVITFISNFAASDEIKTSQYKPEWRIDKVPYAVHNDYGDNVNGTPISQSDYDNWKNSGFPDIAPYGNTHRYSIGYPEVRLYGTRESGISKRFMANDKTITTYGNYQINTVAVSIGKLKSLIPDQETEHSETGIYKEPNNNFTINLSSAFNNVIKISMESFSFTNSIYTFSTARKNNYFEILYDVGTPPGGKGNITIPDGTYTAEQLVTYLNKKTKDINHNFNVRYSTITGKLFFYDVTLKSFTLIFGSNTNTDISQDGHAKLNTNIEKNAGWAMGFKRSYYISTTETNISKTLNPGERGYAPDDDKIIILNDTESYVPAATINLNTSPNQNHYVEAESIYNKDSCKTLFLVVDDFNYNNYNNHYNTFDGEMVSSNILAKIQLKNNQSDNFSYIHDTMGDLEYRVRVFLGPVRIERLHIKLIDAEGEPVDIHETDYNLSLRFDTLYNI